MKLIIIFLFVFASIFFFGCGERLIPKECAYCKGQIVFQVHKNTLWGNEYTQQFSETNSGVVYHIWCIKILRLEKRLENLEVK